MKTIKVKRLYEDAQRPTLGSEKAAGFDLYAYVDILDTNNGTIVGNRIGRRKHHKARTKGDEY